MTLPPHDAAHRAMLRELRQRDSASCAEFEALARLAAHLLQCPVAWIGLHDGEGHHWLQAAVGVPLHTLPPGAQALMTLQLASTEPISAEPISQGVVDGTSVATAHIVLKGHPAGLLCASAPHTRRFDDESLTALGDLAQLAGSLLEACHKEHVFRLQELRVRTASLSGSDWLWESDADGHMVWISSGVEAHTGRAPVTEIGLTASQINRPSPDDLTGSWRRYEEARAKRLPFRDLIAERDTPNGVVTVSISGTPLFDDDGGFCGYRGATSNISERKRAELALAERQEQLHESQAQLSAVLEAVPDLWFVLDHEGRYLKCSSPTHPMLLHGWDTVRGQPFEAGVPQPVADRVLVAVQRTLATGTMQRIDYELTTADGVPRVFEARITPMPHRQVLYVTRDLTELRTAEQALVTAEERWKFALEGSGDGVWDWDARTNKLFYSARWKEIRGYADHEIGDSASEWRLHVHPEDMPRILSAIRQHLDGEVPFYEVEYRVAHRLGHELWIRDRGKIVKYSADGQAERIVGTQTDITHSKQTEQMLRDRQAAILASQAKSEFLSRMSHEMRTPLNAVIGFSQLLGLNPEALEAGTVRDYAAHVLNAGEHLLALIDDVLDLQKIEEGALSLNLGPLDLHEAIKHILELLAPTAQAGQVGFDNQVAAGAWVHADMQRLRQVLLNVGSNAVKYNQPGGHVRWYLEGGDAGRLTLCVEDNGAGMNAQQMSRLFQPFERLGRETSAIEGTGLGLIIARSLTQAVGGRLDVASVAGRGTCVRIELQCADAPAGKTPTPTPTLAKAQAKQGLRMLYVEDNRINAILFEEAMRMHGSQVELRVAEDGDQALSLAQSWQPEMLVLDAHLPGISGFEVLRLLRALPGLGNVPAYMCSADAMPDDVQRAYEAGFIGYWTKPINVAAVLADIEQCVQRTRGKAATDDAR